jgi:hypothetical protein
MDWKDLFRLNRVMLEILGGSGLGMSRKPGLNIMESAPLDQTFVIQGGFLPSALPKFGLNSNNSRSIRSFLWNRFNVLH